MEKYTIDLPNEEWRDIKGYESLYKISNMGRVRSLPKLKRTPSATYYTKDIILPYRYSKGGYYRVVLCKNNDSKSFFVHKLVANAFIGEQGHLTVNHKNEDKSDNRVENLEYLTRADNVRYGSGIKRSALSRIDNPNVRKTAVNQYDLNGVFIERYISINQAKRELGIKSNNISMCCKHERRQANGFIWRYDGDDVLI